MTDQAGGRSCLKTGCLVLVGCLGLGVMIVALVAGLAWMKASSSKPESQVLTRPVPEQPIPPSALAADLPQEGILPKGGRVVLNLSEAEFQIEPGPPGEPIRVEASYDRASGELEEIFEPGDAGSWTYSLRFKRDLGFLAKMFEGMAGKTPKVRVLIPPDVPIDLDIDLSEGEGLVRLGGLWLTSADLTFSMGGVEMSIDEPLKEPIESLSIKASMGGGSFRSLGNASPRRLDVDISMGGMDLDLTGRWLRDAEIQIRQSMGGAGVTLPDGVIIEGIDHPRTGRQASSKEIPLPVLRFTVSSEMGELKFND